MRASRLLQILLILQNRGRQTATQLGQELEVTPRTILRDVDAMTEAGLPIIVFQGNRGGIELGFNYRTRLTGLSMDEAEALGIRLATPIDALGALGLGTADRRACAKLIESLPDKTRLHAARAQDQFRLLATRPTDEDPRVPALAEAVRHKKRVRLRSRTKTPQMVHPIGLTLRAEGWALTDALTTDIPQSEWGDLNISNQSFQDAPADTNFPRK